MSITPGSVADPSAYLRDERAGAVCGAAEGEQQ
jgi:hypothetical protein